MGCVSIGLIAIAIILSITLLFWWAALSGATNRRDAAWERLRAAGIATSTAELAAQVDPVPDELNPVVEYRQAWSMLDQKNPDFQAWNNYDIPQWARTPEEEAEYAQLERAAVEAFPGLLEAVAAADPKVRPSVDHVRADFGVWSEASGPLPADMISVLLPHLNQLRQLAILVAADANVAAAEGDGERLLLNVIRLLGMADALDSDAHMVVEHLVAVGIRALATKAVLDHPEEAAGAPKDLRARVIALLLEDESSSQGYRSGMAGEATMQQAIMTELDAGRMAANDLSGRGGLSLPGALMRPIMRDDAAQMATVMLVVRDAADAPRLPEARRAMPDLRWLDQGHYGDVFIAILLPSLDRSLETEYRQRTDRRLAATLLAIRTFERDHGQLPVDLSALVPDYLPALPIDPLSTDADLQYDPVRGLLWSVGIDGVDNGGDVTPRGKPEDFWNWADRVVRLRPEAAENGE
jgi:hypothetical protein